MDSNDVRNDRNNVGQRRITMFDGLRYIELSGKKYPIKCDLIVLEKMQDEFGKIGEIENKLTGFVPKKEEDGRWKRNKEGLLLGTYETPDIKVLNKTLCWMVKEGLDIESGNGYEQNKMDEKAIIRSVDISPRELSDILHEEFSKCFERKNEKTTQRNE